MKSEIIRETECCITPEAAKKSATNIIPSGNVVIATRVGLGKVCLLDQDTAINQDLRGIIPKSQKHLSVPFLFWWLKSIANLIIAEGTGATVQGVKLTFIKSLDVPIPPLSEQQRIVGILDEAFDGVATAKANAEKNLSNASELFNAWLNSVFSQRGDGWVNQQKQLIDLCELIVDCEHKTAPTQNEGIPSIRTPNIGKGRLILDGVYRVSEKTYHEWTRRAEPRAGDLIMAREAPAGNVAVIPENIKLCLGQRTLLLRPKTDIFDPEFLAFYLLQPEIQSKLLAHSRGATVQHVNMKDIRALEISTIPLLSIQRDIVSTIKIIETESEKLSQLYRQKIEALDALKQSILHQAFSGAL